ncbi:FAD/NAD(P)-binding oxidoreductase [Nostocoides veronense]|uniref:FAD-dependent oxidoreductase n=1 Tax=Nostocoides veronense TaxID=330836 RepID=A0ABN2M1K0_9MICO
MESYGLIVLGSGPAGISAAQAYVEAGGPGPVIVLTADADAPYERPPLSKETLTGSGPAEPTPLTEAVLPDGVELRLATVAGDIDPDRHTLRTGGELLAFDRLIVATGSRPVPFPGADADADIHTLRTLADATALSRAATHARTALVIGSGFIGCEAAASLARRGIATTIVTPESTPQADRLGPYAAQQISSWLTDLGVELRTGVSVTAIRAPRTVHLDDGTTLEPDLILAAVGIIPQGEVAAVGEATAYQGRLVADEHLQVTDGVWVAGDAARAMHGIVGRALDVEHWGDALAMGALAGRNAAAPEQQQVWSEVPGFWSTIGEHTLQYAAWGDGFERAEVAERVGGFTIWYADAEDVLVGVLAYNADADYERGRRLIAAQAGIGVALSGGDLTPEE